MTKVQEIPFGTGPPQIYNEKINYFTADYNTGWMTIHLRNGKCGACYSIKDFDECILPSLRKRGIVEANSLRELIDGKQ